MHTFRVSNTTPRPLSVDEFTRANTLRFVHASVNDDYNVCLQHY